MSIKVALPNGANAQLTVPRPLPMRLNVPKPMNLRLTLPNIVSAQLIIPQPPNLRLGVPQNPHMVVLPARGPRGLRGLSGDGAQIFGEVPVGVKDGINTHFTLSGPYRTGTIALYLNGLRETYFSEFNATTIAFEDPPLASDDIRVDYVVT